MNLYRKLSQLDESNKALRVGLIGAGKFATMYLAQIPKTPGIHLAGIADLLPDSARNNLSKVGWSEEQYGAVSLDDAISKGSTFVGDNWEQLVRHPDIDIIIEATGSPMAAVSHVLEAIEHGKHIVMVTVEADVFCGPLLKQKADTAGVVYSLAYGDQPALICELVDWARASGFNVKAAGRGHKWLPQYKQSTPETVWDHWGVTEENAKLGGLNPKMFNSFLDGSKPAIESTAVCNASDLRPAAGGLVFPSGSVEDIPNLMRLKSEGGMLSHDGQVEVISSLRPDGTEIPYHIRQGVWVVFDSGSEYVKRCFGEYHTLTDSSGRYGCMYKRWHLIGLEVGISVASIGIRNESTGCATYFNADVVAEAKRNLKAGEILDGEGGYTVVGQLTPAKESVRSNALPLGLAQGWKLKKSVGIGEIIRWEDVVIDETNTAVRCRKEMEAAFA